MFILIYRFICGYLRIRISGDYPERFINSCSVNNIKLWNYHKSGKDIYVNIKIKDYLHIRRIRKNTKVYLKIIKRYGLPIIIKPYLNRMGLMFGVLLFIFINVFLSKFIWNIDIVGNKNISDIQILNYCRKIGIKEGVFSSNIDTNQARLDLLMKYDDLSWASFIIEGSHLTVNISETKTVDSTNDNSPSNAVAACDAIVDEIKVIKGRTLVRQNQAVLKGEILVSGTIGYTDGRTTFVKSEAEIIGKTKRSLSVTLPYEKIETSKTGQVHNTKVLEFFGIKIPLSYKPITYKNYIKKIKSEKIEVMESYLPIYLHSAKYLETRKRRINLSKKSAYKYAKEKLTKLEKNKLTNVVITDFAESVTYNKDTITITRNYNCKENIVSYEKIKINTVN